jgi:hypothetical protein
MTSTANLGCCPCPNGRFVAYPCWSYAGRTFNYSGTNGTVDTFTTTPSGNTNSLNPPTGTEAFLVLVGAGGAGSGPFSGGGGAYVETKISIPPTSFISVGRGGQTTNIGNIVFGGGRIGPTPGAITPTTFRYGGGATRYRTGTSSSTSTTDVFIAAGGGGAASLNFFSETGAHGRGGDGGMISSTPPTGDDTSGGSASNTSPGQGGDVGGGSGSLGVLPNSGGGGFGAPIDPTTAEGGGGGGGGGYGAGGGGGNFTSTVTPIFTYGGAGSGGASFVGNSDYSRSFGGKRGFTQASQFTGADDTRGIGDGGTGIGGNGRAVIQWRACYDCPCSETPSTGMPNSLHICLTLEQFQQLLDTASYSDGDCESDYIGFTYKGWPYYISRSEGTVGIDRPCEKVVDTADISGGKFVSGPEYCCMIWSAIKITTPAENCLACQASPTCPDTIYFCESYLNTIGVSWCDILNGNCIVITYDGCDYSLLTTPVDGDCLTTPPSPLNVGSVKENTEPPCGDSGPPQSEWTVGPSVYNGGIQCGDTYTFTLFSNGKEFANSRNAECVTMTDYSGSFVVACGGGFGAFSPIVGIDDPVCPSTTPNNCVCSSDLTEECTTSLQGQINSIKKQGICNTIEPPPGGATICSNPLHTSRFGMLFLEDFVFDGSVFHGACQDDLSPALTITRSCDGTAFSWCSASSNNSEGVVTIDGCTFRGNGTPAQFAAVINSVLGSKGISASGSSNYWWGPRWRGTKDYPFDLDCAASFHISDFAGDVDGNAGSATYVGDGKTQAVIYARRPVIKLQTTVEIRPGEFAAYSDGTGPLPVGDFLGCFCSTGEECRVLGFYNSENCVTVTPSRIFASDFGTVTLDFVNNPDPAHPPAQNCAGSEWVDAPNTMTVT